MGRIAWLARVWSASSVLTFDAMGTAPPGTYAVQNPGPLDSVTVRLTTTAVAPFGTGHRSTCWTCPPPTLVRPGLSRVSSTRTDCSSPTYRPEVVAGTYAPAMSTTTSNGS